MADPDPDLQIGGGGAGRQDPEIRGGSHTKFSSAPQFGLKIRGGAAPYSGSTTDLVLFSIIKVVYNIKAE